MLPFLYEGVRNGWRFQQFNGVTKNHMDEMRQWANGLKNNRNIQIAIAVAVLIIVLAFAWWAWGRSVAAQEPTKDIEATTTVQTVTDSGVSASSDFSNPTAAASGEMITVQDQPASTSVKVVSVTLEERGWIAVRDANGWILGAGLFPAGTHENVDVPLLRGTTAGERYQVLLYIDNGNKAFDLHDDILVTNSDGSVAGTTFTAQ